MEIAEDAVFLEATRTWAADAAALPPDVADVLASVARFATFIEAETQPLRDAGFSELAIHALLDDAHTVAREAGGAAHNAEAIRASLNRLRDTTCAMAAGHPAEALVDHADRARQILRRVVHAVGGAAIIFVNVAMGVEPWLEKVSVHVGATLFIKGTFGE